MKYPVQLQHPSQHGFSLIELMIVIAIVGVLSAVAIPQYQNYVMRAKWSVNLSQIEPLKLAISECLLENGMTSSACDTAAEIQTTLPQPKYAASNGITVSSTSTTLTIAVIGNNEAGSCKIEMQVDTSAGDAIWAGKTVANGSAPSCSKQQTGLAI
jgi:type IV pilus assembly protein PilA